MTKRIPVILDTDLGDDIDDAWALAMMLNSPELDVKMILTDAGDTIYRARVVAKLLEVAGRTDIPIAVGVPWEMTEYSHKDWVKDYKLGDYPGPVYRDGVGAFIDTLMNSPEPITVICIGPVPNIGAALGREPRIAEHARFVGMHGSVYKGYGDSDQIAQECNVVCYTPDCQKAFLAPWEMTITPLDTCGLIQLKGEHFQKILQCTDPLIQAIIEIYDIWDTPFATPKEDRNTESSILFDTVAIHLAYSEKFLEMEELGIRVTDDGFTLIDETAKPIRVATKWTDMNGFLDDLVARLTAGRAPSK